MNRRAYLSMSAAVAVNPLCGLVNRVVPALFGSFPALVPAGIRKLGSELDLPEKYVAADPNKTLSAEPIKFANFGAFKTVIDNPPLPMGPISSDSVQRQYTVVFVAGNPTEREKWAKDARSTYGRNVFVYNDAFSVKDVANRLAPFPASRVRTLIFGGHSGPSGGLFMGIERPQTSRLGQAIYHFDEPAGCESINARNLEQHPDELATIIGSLSADATVQFQTCCVADDFNCLVGLSRALKSAVIASNDLVQGWGFSQGEWHRIEKPK